MTSHKTPPRPRSEKLVVHLYLGFFKFRLNWGPKPVQGPMEPFHNSSPRASQEFRTIFLATLAIWQVPRASRTVLRLGRLASICQASCSEVVGSFPSAPPTFAMIKAEIQGAWTIPHPLLPSRTFKPSPGCQINYRERPLGGATLGSSINKCSPVCSPL